MFEQDSYSQDMPATPTQEGDLFHKYEIRPWDFSPRIYKILGVSALVNVLFFAAFAQANFLTMRGCDSPFVGRVCTVLDMAYVGTVLFGTEREYIDVAYERTDLGDMDVTFISMDGAEPMFEYPPGYFQVANPDQFQTDQQNGFDMANSGFRNQYPGISSNPTINNDLSKQQQRLPKYNPKAVEGKEGDPYEDEDEDPTVAQKDPKGKPGNGNANTNANNSSNGTSANSNTGTTSPESVLGVDINKRPMIDLANMVNDLKDKNAINVESEFVVNARGKLDKNGRLEPKTFRYVQASSDDQMILEVVKKSIEAINDAGYLQYLKDLSGKDFNLLLEQDEENITAVVQSELESETRARSIRSALNLAIGLAKTRKQSENADQNDKDDLLLLENAVIEANGKKVIIRFTVPKAVAHPMIQRKLAEQKAEQAKPNGNAGIRPGDNTAAR